MKNILCILLLGFLVGCAGKPQLPVSMEDNFLQKESKTVGVVMTHMPTPDVHIYGASCLLCVAAAEIANSSLSDHVESLKPEEFKLIKSQLVQQLEDKGVTIVAIEENISIENLPENSVEVVNEARSDFTSYATTYNITHLLVIDVDLLGMHRTYSGYIPTSDPKAVLTGKSYLVDLSDNTYKWYKPISIFKAANGEWDEPPYFPALTNAYFQSIETGREQILAEF